MDDPNQNQKSINTEISNKVENIIKKLTLDMTSSYIESLNLDELRKTLKVFF